MYLYTSAERSIHSRGLSVDVCKGLMVKECHVEPAGAMLCGMGIHEVMVLSVELSPCMCRGRGGGEGWRSGGAGGGCRIQERGWTEDGPWTEMITHWVPKVWDAT